MSNITIRKQNGDKAVVGGQVDPSWDPWRAMRALLSWDPFREMAPFPAFEERDAAFAPSFDIKETKDSYQFKADVPGIQDKDLEVTITGNRLTVGGKRDAEREEKGPGTMRTMGVGHSCPPLCPVRAHKPRTLPTASR